MLKSSSDDASRAYEAVVERLVAEGHATAGKMFGMPALLRGGKGIGGLHEETMVFKLSGEAHSRALALRGAGLFDPSGRGRPMKQWVQVPLEHRDSWYEFGLAAASA